MSANDFLSSNLSECNSVLDLPATFSLPVGDGQLMSDEDIDGCTSESTVNTLFSVKPTIDAEFYEWKSWEQYEFSPAQCQSTAHHSTVNNSPGSDHPNSEDGLASANVAELHPSSEDKQRCTGITQTMEDFFKGTEQKKPLESNPLSEKIVRLLTSKISQLKQEKGGQYLLRSFQMALVSFHTHGPDIFKQGNANNMHFCCSVSAAGDSAEFHPLPGLSQDVVSFIQQEILK